MPNLSTTFNVDYRWPVFANFSAYVGGSETYTGTRYTAFSPTVSIIEPHVELPSYSTLQLRAGLDNGHYDIQIYGNNPDQQGRHSRLHANSGGANQTGLASFIQPRTLGIEVERQVLAQTSTGVAHDFDAFTRIGGIRTVHPGLRRQPRSPGR